LLCKDFATFVKASPRLCPTAILALYLPILTYGQKGLAAPKIVWIDPEHEMHIVERKPDDTLEYIDPLKHDPIEAEFTQPRNMSIPVNARGFDINRNYFKKFKLMYPVVLHMRDAFNFDGSRPNITLVEVTKEQLRMQWKGPLVVYSKDAFHSSACQDITLSDFRTFLDFCKKYDVSGGGLSDSLRLNNYLELELTNPGLFNSLLLHNSANQTIRGVEITCEGDRHFLATEQFLSVDVPVVHPIFDDVNNDNGYIAGFGATEVSRMIQVPLLVRRLFPDKEWNNKTFLSHLRPQNWYSNSVAQYLNLNTDITSTEWGCRDPGYNSGQIYSRVLVVREDKLAITVRQVEAVAAFFKNVFETLDRQKLVQLGGLSGPPLHAARGNVMGANVSRARFVQFFTNFRDQKVQGGDTTWGNEVLP
jgi:hypothetical protein